MYLTLKQIKNDLKKNKDFNVYISDRAGRKSSVIQEFLIENALKGNPSVLIRSKIDESINISWLSEYVKKKYENKYTFSHSKIDKYIDVLYIHSGEDKYIMCYGFYLSVFDKYKSSYLEEFEKIKYIIWEECIPNKPVIQKPDYILKKCMNDINSIISIRSTICRDNPAQFIFLGNDIKENIINPITVTFNLLDDLESDIYKSGKCVIDDRKYTFLFLYFSFPKSVEHWLHCELMDIDILNITNGEILNYDLFLNGRHYYIYSFDDYFYISDKFKKSKDNTNIYQFFKKHNCEHLLKKYNQQFAISMAISFNYFSRQDFINEFENIYNPKIKKIDDKKILLDIKKLQKQKISTFKNSIEHKEIQKLNEMKNKKDFIYCNILIKINFDDLLLRGVI